MDGKLTVQAGETVTIRDEHGMVAMMSHLTKTGRRDSDAVVARAHQLAAAPALAEALEEVMEWVNNWSPDFIGDQEWPETEAKIDAALSQARGGK